MKRLIGISILVTICYSSLFAQLPDSVQKALDEKMEQYTQAIETESLDTQCEEADFMIKTCQDSLVRQYVAIKLYSHYVESKLMGSENVAVHIFDKWFSDGNVKMSNDADDLAARLFVQVNRQSLIGMKAPSLCLEGTDGEEHLIPDSSSRFSVLFFYNIDCPKCRIEAVMLRNILENSDYPIDVYTIYVGKDKNGWIEYQAQELNPDCVNTRIFNLRDAADNSSIVEKYGLLQTPRIFLLNPEKTILGRSLDSVALSQMLQKLLVRHELGYGDEASVQFFDSLLSDAAQVKDVTDIADVIASRSLKAADTTLFRQLTGDMLYYLSSKRKEPYVSGCNYLIDNYIINQGKVWNTSDDSLKVVSLAQMLKQLHAKTPVGSRIPDIKLYGTLRESSGVSHTGFLWTRELRSKSTLILFHTSSCPVCQEQIKAAEESQETVSKRKVFEVDVDMALSKLSQEEGRQMMETFDLSGLPFVLEINSKGVILGKYLNL